VLLEVLDYLRELSAPVKVKVLEGRLVVVTTIGVSQEPSLEVGDQIDRLDMLGGHLGVDLVGDPDELRGVAVDIFMVEDVSGPETCEEVGSVDIRVRRELLDQSGIRGKQVMWSACSNEMLPFGGTSIFDCRSSSENCHLWSWRRRREMDRLPRSPGSEVHAGDRFAHRVQVGMQHFKVRQEG
jgi:hypothetical protein